MVSNVSDYIRELEDEIAALKTLIPREKDYEK
jgi:hypothetical protein